MEEVPSKEKTPRLTSRLILRGDLDPDEVTRRVGLQPSSTWRRGEAVDGSQSRWDDSGWMISQGPTRAFELAPQIEELLSLIEPIATEVLSAAADLGLSTIIYCVAHVEDQTPVIEIGPDLLRRIADIGARLSVDVVLSEL